VLILVSVDYLIYIGLAVGFVAVVALMVILRSFTSGGLGDWWRKRRNKQKEATLAHQEINEKMELIEDIDERTQQTADKLDSIKGEQDNMKEAFYVVNRDRDDTDEEILRDILEVEYVPSDVVAFGDTEDD
jgi:seryl-tRNA synthetase